MDDQEDLGLDVPGAPNDQEPDSPESVHEDE